MSADRLPTGYRQVTDRLPTGYRQLNMGAIVHFYQFETRILLPLHKWIMQYIWFCLSTFHLYNFFPTISCSFLINISIFWWSWRQFLCKCKTSLNLMLIISRKCLAWIKTAFLLKYFSCYILVTVCFVYLFTRKCLCFPCMGYGWFYLSFKDLPKLSRHKFWEHLFTIVLKCISPLKEGNTHLKTFDGMMLLHCKYNARNRLRVCLICWVITSLLRSRKTFYNISFNTNCYQ